VAPALTHHTMDGETPPRHELPVRKRLPTSGCGKALQSCWMTASIAATASSLPSTIGWNQL
jgi:hypothetical protein